MKRSILLILSVLIYTSVFAQIQTDSLMIKERILADSLNIHIYPVSGRIQWVPYDTELNAFVVTTGYQYRKTGFDTFHEFDSESLKQLSDMNHYLHLKLGGYFDNKYLELGYHGGGNTYPPLVRDDLTSFISFGWALNAAFGYGLHSGDLRLVFTPYAGLQTNIFRYRSFYGEVGSDFPLTDYLSQNNYDIKFRQWSAIAGYYLDYKVFTKYDSMLAGSMYLSLSMGYSQKLHGKPFIKSAGNQLTSDGKIKMSGFFVGAGLRFYIYE